jgi:hypothetical protein
MPNHIRNLLSISGEKELVTKSFEEIKGEKNEVIDFNKIIPMPEWVINAPNEGMFPDWYVWSNDNWGTKWNAYGQDNPVNQSRGNSDPIRFSTAWSTPYPVMVALSAKYPDLTIRVDYADEDAGSNCGFYVLKNGSDIDSEEYKYNDLQNRGMEKYFQLHPERKVNWKLKDGKYVHVEDEDEDII